MHYRPMDPQTDTLTDRHRTASRAPDLEITEKGKAAILTTRITTPTTKTNHDKESKQRRK